MVTNYHGKPNNSKSSIILNEFYSGLYQAERIWSLSFDENDLLLKGKFEWDRQIKIQENKMQGYSAFRAK